ncbi:hypothetical protein ACLOJK_030482 [Asimina triloba]
MVSSSVWRTKGSLTNYTPLHARPELVDSRDYNKVPKVKSISIKIKEPKFQSKKQYEYNTEVESKALKSEQNFRKVFEEDTSNRSSIGSAISYSESCSHISGADASSAQSNVWDSMVPSKKRTCVGRPKQSSVEKLTKDLNYILHEQQQSSYFSGSSEEDLLFESDTPLVSVEIGHGSVLIRHPNSMVRDEESEASSLPIDGRTHHIVNDVFSVSTSLPVNTENKGIKFSNVDNENFKKPTEHGERDHTKRDSFSQGKIDILQNKNSPLGKIDLTDVANFEEFARHLTHEEQLQLMKFLPSPDAAKAPDSLGSLLSSPPFVEALSLFQKLLLEGVFDLSFPGVKTEDCMNLKSLALINVTKSKWVEQYQQLKDLIHKKMQDGKVVAVGTSSILCAHLAHLKRPRDDQNQHLAETNGALRSPKRVHKGSNANLSAIKSLQLNHSDVGAKGSDVNIDDDGSSFSPRSLFAFPPDRSLMDSLQFTDDSSEQDLLLDVPSNTSFPQAELIPCHSWNQKTLPNGPLVENK